MHMYGPSIECLDHNCVLCVSLCSSLHNLQCAVCDVDLNAAAVVDDSAFRDALLRQDRKVNI